MQKDGYFSRVNERDSGLYICTRSYLYHGQLYNMTFRVALEVQPSSKTKTIFIEVDNLTRKT